MFDWELRDPWFLLACFLAPLAYFVSTRSSSWVQFSSLMVPDQAPRTLRGRLTKLPAVLTAVAVALLAIALAGPRTPNAETQIYREGIAIMMVVDRSSSMDARDLVRDDRSVNRLTVVQEVFQRFVLGGGHSGRGRPDDMIGLVAFAGYADSLCPLTLDHGNLVSMATDIEIVRERSEDGTAIGEGLALAVERLRRNRSKSKIAILLTDGVSNRGDIQPRQAAELAADHDIKVYCIGAGTSGLAPFPADDPFTGRRVLVKQRVEIDEETLQEIARKTGGRYFRANDADALEDIYAVIDRLERTKITEVRYLEYTEHYAAFVTAAFGLVAFASIASRSALRRLP